MEEIFQQLPDCRYNDSYNPNTEAVIDNVKDGRIIFILKRQYKKLRATLLSRLEQLVTQAFQFDGKLLRTIPSVMWNILETHNRRKIL